MAGGLADEALVQLAEAQTAGRVAEGDGKLNVTFGYFPVEDTEAPAHEGRRTFKDVLFVRKVVPGDKNNIVHRPAYHEDFRRFPRQYEAFKQGQAEAVTGMPLREWPQITRSEAETLASWKVLTVEHLAELSDAAISEIGRPIRHLVDRARAHIQAAKEQAPAAQFAAQLKAKEAEMEAMRAQLKKQGEQLEQLAKASGQNGRK